MIDTGENTGRVRGLIRIACITVICLLFPIIILAQEPPPRPLEVNTTAQELSFGTFSMTGGGGSVTVYANGSRGFGGSVVLLSMSPFHSTTRLELIANPGTLVSLLIWPSSVISDGSHTMSFTLDSSQPLLPLVITTEPPAATILDLGATLTVGSLISNPPGNYTGTYNITFFQE